MPAPSESVKQGLQSSSCDVLYSLSPNEMANEVRQRSTAGSTMDAANNPLQHKSSLEGPGLMLGKDEKAVLQGQMASPTSWHYPARFLPSCTSSLDGIIIILSAIAAIIGGAANSFEMVSILLPCFQYRSKLTSILLQLLLGNVGRSFRGFFVGVTTLEDFRREVNQLSLFYVYLAILEFGTIYAATVGFTLAGERIGQRIRER